MNKAYNYNFKMFMEGIAVPFNSIQIMCTPNGVEANINLLANKEALDLKPKTAVQVFYKDWVAVEGKFMWRLMFDGFLSSYVKSESSTDGRGLSIVCRDFRMDIRKAPAALAFQGSDELTPQHSYSTSGINQTVVIHGFSPKKPGSGSAVKTYGNDGLQDIGVVVARIAGVAYGTGKTPQNVGKGLVPSVNESQAGLFLDAVIRGIWAESTGGTAMSSFLNKRIRVDKRFLVPTNRTGYTFWANQTQGLEIGSVLMDNSRFSSVEAAIMRLAGLFSARVYSCNTPSLIPIGGDALQWIMDQRAKEFLVDNNKEFGAKYILNETMLLPPLEFTAPPNCNLFFPPMYNNVSWQHDMDGDVTRGYFSVANTLSTEGSVDLGGMSVQVPNALFQISKGHKDAYGRAVLPLTLEERYKGVSVYYGSVEDFLARRSACKTFPEMTYKKSSATKAREEEKKIKQQVSEAKGKSTTESNISKANKATIDTEVASKKKLKAPGGGYSNSNARKAQNRHATIKFLNVKYAGRVAVVDMAFNPYPMSGFPGAIIVDDEAFGKESGKTIIGMVQQVKHLIIISPEGGEASTSVVLNNARMEDEATDVDGEGNPLYMKETNPLVSEINKRTFAAEDPKALVKRDLSNKYYDLDINKASDGYIYVKDVVTLSEKDILNAKNNAFYLDEEYMPNRIHKFYGDVFNHKEDHFMVDTFTDNGATKKFAYNTMHEAFVKLRKRRKNLLTNYEDCMKYIHRNICSADAFYQGILGLSVKEVSEDNNGNRVTKFIVNNEKFKDDVIHDEYFGVSTNNWNKSEMDGLKHPTGLMTAPGQFSSINEHSPVTAFIQERRDAVKTYLDKIKLRVEGSQFSNVQR